MEKDSETNSVAEMPSRRGFVNAVIYALGAAMGAALAIPAVRYLFLPPKTRKQQAWVEAGDISNLAVDVPQEMTFRRIHADGWKIYSEKGAAWVVKTADDKILAYSPACTHLGCAYHWDAANSDFLCPCHGSTFALDGKVLSGPAPRPLDQYEIKIENARLFLGPVHQSSETSS
jgi:menaquinol-cytochrome c reductase iron-sulfur subunit